MINNSLDIKLFVVIDSLLDDGLTKKEVMEFLEEEVELRLIEHQWQSERDQQIDGAIDNLQEKLYWKDK